MRSVYGPVSSWRLGSSLGIDPLPAEKTCTFDCVYCQLGRTEKKVSSPGDVELPSAQQIINEMEKFELGVKIDYVTFSGRGEPTLHPELGMLIENASRIFDAPVAVLTNSSLLPREDVREGVNKADLVVAKLDAPNNELFEIINRPCNPDLEKIVDGIKKVGTKLSLQIMLIRQNCSEESVKGLAELAQSIDPDVVYLNTPVRPCNASPLGIDEMEGCKKTFVEHGLKAVHRFEREGPKIRIGWERMARILERRPCTLQEIRSYVGAPPEDVLSVMRELERNGMVKKIVFQGKEYYSAVGSRAGQLSRSAPLF